MHYDTIVIGAGLSGLMAALIRAERGERVMLLAKGNGTTHWAAGCVDLLDSEGNPLEAIDEVAADRPDHPYALAGTAAIQAGIARLQAACADAGYPLVGSPQQTLWMPTALGSFRPTGLIPVTMSAGERRQLPAEGRGRLLIAGFHQLRDFFPPLIAANLREQGFAAEGAYLELPPTGRTRDFSTVSFARLFDQPAFRTAVGRQLRTLAQQGGYSHIALPAVIGLRQPLAALREIQDAAGALIFEIPTLPASVPGMRLYQILEAALMKAGARVQLGSFVQRTEHEGERLTALYSEAAAREQRHRAGRFVLATGGVAGGGVRAMPDGELVETALRLPLRAPNSRSGWFAPRFLNEAGHPVFHTGIAVNAQFQPLDAAGRPVYTNVHVAGAALAGYDPIREGCLEGSAIATGYAVGLL